MRPLDPLGETPSIARLLRSAPVAEVRAEIARVAVLCEGRVESRAEAAAALHFARGALALREGSLDDARAELDAAAADFAAIDEAEARDLALCEALLAAIRRGPRAACAPAIDSLDGIARATSHRRVRAVALHYQGTALRLSGDALATQRALLEAFRAAEPFLEERAQILNSLGTLYVVLGAFGAAEALLSHAAELHHQTGDATGEAIAHGQLGAAALAEGDHARARRHLQKQEWLASRVGDAFGRARALVFLADLALDAGRPDDARDLAERARAIAVGVTPPLSLWIAYATRARGRAEADLRPGSADAVAELASARAQFAQIGNPLGQALCEWDLARAEGAEGMLFGAAWTLGSLGLLPRVARLLSDRRAAAGDARDAAGDAADATADLALAAVAQGAPHIAAAQEVALVYGAPEALAGIAARRTAAQRNLGRLAALAIAPRGLLLAAIASDAIGAARRALPPERAAGAAIVELPGAAIWAFPSAAPIVEVARDLAALRVALGDDTRVRLVVRPLARVVAPPLLGEVSAAVEGVDAAALIAVACALEPAAISIGADVDWPAEAEARAVMAGYVRKFDDL